MGIFIEKNAGLSYFSIKNEKMLRMHTLSQNIYKNAFCLLWITIFSHHFYQSLQIKYILEVF